MKNDFFKYRNKFYELAGQAEIARVYDKAFKVVVLGRFGTGKSTFINALLGECIQAMKAVRCTSVISEIKYGGDFNSISVIYTDGSVKSYDYDGFAKEMTLTEDDQVQFAQIEEYNDGHVSRFDRIHHAELNSNNAFFENDITLVDTPGFEEAVSRDKITNTYLPNANAVIMMLNATSLFSAQECECIAGNFAGKGMCNVFFVINRINQLGNPSQLDSIVKPIVKDHLQKVFTDKNGKFDEELYNKRVFYIDAYGALCAKTGNKASVYVGSHQIDFDVDINATGLPEFESALEQYHIESELRRMAKLYNDNTNGFGFRHRNELRDIHNTELYAKMHLLLELAYETVYSEQPTESDLRQLVI